MAIFNAIKQNDINEITHLLESNKDLYENRDCSDEGLEGAVLTPFSFAAALGRTDVLKILIAHQYNVQTISQGFEQKMDLYHHLTALDVAAITGQVNSFQTIVNNTPFYKTEEGNEAICRAIYRAICASTKVSSKKIKKFLENATSFDVTCGYKHYFDDKVVTRKETLLAAAVRLERVNVANYIIEHGSGHEYKSLCYRYETPPELQAYSQSYFSENKFPPLPGNEQVIRQRRNSVLLEAITSTTAKSTKDKSWMLSQLLKNGAAVGAILDPEKLEKIKRVLGANAIDASYGFFTGAFIVKVDSNKICSLQPCTQDDLKKAGFKNIDKAIFNREQLEHQVSILTPRQLSHIQVTIENSIQAITTNRNLWFENSGHPANSFHAKEYSDSSSHLLDSLKKLNEVKTWIQGYMSDLNSSPSGDPLAYALYLKRQIIELKHNDLPKTDNFLMFTDFYLAHIEKQTEMPHAKRYALLLGFVQHTKKNLSRDSMLKNSRSSLINKHFLKPAMKIVKLNDDELNSTESGFLGYLRTNTYDFAKHFIEKQFAKIDEPFKSQVLNEYGKLITLLKSSTTEYVPLIIVGWLTSLMNESSSQNLELMNALKSVRDIMMAWNFCENEKAMLERYVGMYIDFKRPKKSVDLRKSTAQAAGSRLWSASDDHPSLIQSSSDEESLVKSFSRKTLAVVRSASSSPAIMRRKVRKVRSLTSDRTLTQQNSEMASAASATEPRHHSDSIVIKRRATRHSSKRRVSISERHVSERRPSESQASERRLSVSRSSERRPSESHVSERRPSESHASVRSPSVSYVTSQQASIESTPRGPRSRHLSESQHAGTWQPESILTPRTPRAAHGTRRPSVSHHPTPRTPRASHGPRRSSGGHSTLSTPDSIKGTRRMLSESQNSDRRKLLTKQFSNDSFLLPQHHTTRFKLEDKRNSLSLLEVEDTSSLPHIRQTPILKI